MSFQAASASCYNYYRRDTMFQFRYGSLIVPISWRSHGYNPTYVEVKVFYYLFSEEQEKQNVWVALLNLEVLYGTKESLDKAFQDALKVTDQKKIYMKLVSIYLKNEKIEVSTSFYLFTT